MAEDSSEEGHPRIWRLRTHAMRMYMNRALCTLLARTCLEYSTGVLVADYFYEVVDSCSRLVMAC